MCSTFNVKCSWDGLPEGRNCFCVWSFWCSALCSVDQMVTVQRGSVLDVRGPEWFYQPFFSLRTSTVPGEWGGLYQWFAQQFGLFSVVCIMQTNAINIIKSYLINVLSARVKFESPKIHLVKTCFVSQFFFELILRCMICDLDCRQANSAPGLFYYEVMPF